MAGASTRVRRGARAGTLRLEVTEQGVHASLRYPDHRVGAAVIDVQGVAVVAEYPPARKHDLTNVALPFVGFLGPEHPLVGARQHLRRVVPVEQSEPGAVYRACRCDPHAVVAKQPAVPGKQRRRAEPDLAVIPPATWASGQHYPGVAPVLEVGAE